MASMELLYCDPLGDHAPLLCAVYAAVGFLLVQVATNFFAAGTCPLRARAGPREVTGGNG
jgi:hypothetical protein